MSLKSRRLLIAEDDTLVAALLAQVLESQGFHVRTAATAAAARDVAKEFDPDAALVDIVLGDGPSGLDLAHALHLAHPGIGILFLSKHPDPTTAGVQDTDLPPGAGFLRKSRVNDVDYLLHAIEAVLDDGSVRPQADDDQNPLGVLTRTQLTVLSMMAEGFSNTEIAARRSTSVSALEQTISGMFKAMGIDGRGPLNPRVEAVRRYIDAVGLPDRR